jgi:hypothetical protein
MIAGLHGKRRNKKSEEEDDGYETGFFILSLCRPPPTSFFYEELFIVLGAEASNSSLLGKEKPLMFLSILFCLARMMKKLFRCNVFILLLLSCDRKSNK